MGALMNLDADSSEEILKSLASRIDKSEAQVAALMEVRKDLFDRVSQLTEHLGELRSMIVENSKSIESVRIQSSRAADLVESVQPQDLLKEVKRSDLKIESVNEKIDSTELLMQKIIKDMKELRIEIGKFRGVQKLEDMKEDLAKEIEGAKKLTFDVRRDSEKVASFYTDIQEKLKIQTLHDEKLKDLESTIEALTHEVDNTSMSLKKIPDKQSMEKSRREIENIQNQTFSALEETREASKNLKELGKLRERIDSTEEYVERYKTEMKNAIDELYREFNRIKNTIFPERTLQDFGARIATLESRLTPFQDEQEHITTVEERLSKLEEQQSILLQLVQSLTESLTKL